MVSLHFLDLGETFLYAHTLHHLLSAELYGKCFPMRRSSLVGVRPTPLL